MEHLQITYDLLVIMIGLAGGRETSDLSPGRSFIPSSPLRIQLVRRQAVKLPSRGKISFQSMWHVIVEKGNHLEI